MPVNINQILTFIGVGSAAHRAIISQDMLPAPDRLENLLDETEEGIRDTCVQYNRGTDPDRFRVPRSVIKKLISLMHWVKEIMSSSMKTGSQTNLKGFI